MWRLGNLSQDLFEDIDFPGMNRTITFLEYCEPLDEANLRIKLNKCTEAIIPDALSDQQKECAKAWEISRPKVGGDSPQLCFGLVLLKLPAFQICFQLCDHSLAPKFLSS
jgi:hypothetical protein